MSDTFVHYVETDAVVSDGRREVHAGLGEVGGIQLAWLCVGKEDVLLTLAEMRKLTAVLQGMDPEVWDRTSGYYLYRVEITKYPPGSWIEEEFGCYPDPEWTPEGWAPDDGYVFRFRSDRFFWPSVHFDYKSKSSAKSRARLIESYGATTRIVQSSLITWPAPEILRTSA